VIKASGLYKRYGNTVAVNNISFTVERGVIFGFLGPNGAGKSTTQRILTGVTKPDAGVVEIASYNLSRQPLKAREVAGVVPEMANVYVDLSAWENLMFVGEVYGVGKKKRAERAAAMLEVFGLFEKRHLRAKGFSKGMKQRLLLCMALMGDPEVLFLDEPTSGLDVQSTLIIRELIRDYNRQGKTIFLTTHNIEEANQLCDLVAIINRGELIVVDRPENLRKTFTSLQTVEVAFQPQFISPDLLKKTDVTKRFKKQGDKYIFYTEHPGQVIFSITELCRSEGVDILSLQTLRPSLENVFLDVTGKLNESGGKENDR
jgi:ABC-2 type transport system ATP-binding protein